MTSASETHLVQPYSFPFGPAQRLELHPRYAQLRIDQPVARIEMPYGGQAWLVTRHADVKIVRTDPRFIRTAPIGKDIPRIAATMPAFRVSSILTSEGAEHTRLRKLVAKAFTVRRISALRPWVEDLVDTLLDTMIAAGAPVDLAAMLAWPLPVAVICELLGVPPTDRARFGTWAHLIQAVAEREQMEKASNQLETYLAELIARRRAEPSQDVLGALVAARDEEDRLSESELVTMGVTLLVGGYETTANQLANSVYTLLSRREDLWEPVVANSELVPRAVEELLRSLPLFVEGAPLFATEDLELGEVTIRAGDAVIISTFSANRDSAVFQEPEEIDLSRTDNPHLTFGHGMHHCLGAPLARMELQVALRGLIRRLPTLHLAVPPEDVTWRTGHQMRGVEALPVTW